MIRSLAFVALLAASVSSALAQAPVPSPKAASDFKGASTCRVLRVIDGDTVVLMIAGKATTVCLIGVDTPETVHPSKPVERFGKEASAFLRKQAEGTVFYLEYEDRGGRLD